MRGVTTLMVAFSLPATSVLHESCISGPAWKAAATADAVFPVAK